METAKSISDFLIAEAQELRDGKPIESVLQDLEEAIEEWREQFPNE